MKRPRFSIHYLFFIVALLLSSCSDDKNPDPDPKPNPPAKQKYEVQISPISKKMATGQEHKLNLQINPIYEGETTIKWESDNSTIATITNEGILKALSVGKIEIRAEVSFNDTTYKTNCQLEVVKASATSAAYRLQLKDKNSYETSAPKSNTYLTDRAIERRQRQGINLEISDYPIHPSYISKVEELGGKIVAKSKWMNTLVVLCDEDFIYEDIAALDFVTSTTKVWSGNKFTSQPIQQPFSNDLGGVLSSPVAHAEAATNISLIKGELLHNAGHTGEGIEIAVLDAGFNNIEKLAPAKGMLIKGVKSFLLNDSAWEIYGSNETYGNHGIWVLSTMATNRNLAYVGTAPKASYHLLRVEDPGSFPIEEDYWIAAAEYADSVGVDIITSSLGFEKFAGEFSPLSYTQDQMDGKTAYTTRGANAASEKGILVVASAGNSSKWISTPADGEHVLTVGGVNSLGNIYNLTSFGNTADGRIKPDVVALAVNTTMLMPTGTVTKSYSGTSFSTPIMAGIAACLWQAYPKLTNKQLLEIIRKSSDRYASPVEKYGYGIPNIQKAITLAEEIK